MKKMKIVDPRKESEKPVPGAGENIEKKSYANRFADSTKSAIEMAWKGMGTEATETREMGVSFFRMLEHQLRLNERDEPPTKEEVKRAIEQLKDVGRISFFASFSIIPGGGISLLGLEILARKFGIKNFTFVPSAFRKRNKDE
ncbi:hypothetical protein ES708_07562 [subsurface metagenome]